MKNRAGMSKKNLSGELAYESFSPSPLPPDPPIELDREGVELLVTANRRLALLDGVASRIPSVKLFISMYVRKEALMSSQIEGTQATLEDVLDPSVNANANLNVAEVINCVRAIDYAVARMKELPLCNRLIRETHAVLMAGARGQEKTPGEFRRSQNWIGGRGSTLKTARFVPPPPEDMETAMSCLEKYMNGDDELDILVKAALIHYQFETIHPFLDGNGRVGRLLVILFLINGGALTVPVLYISYFLKKYRVEYYDRLSEVRLSGNYEQWVKFFLRAICESAKDASDAIDKLNALHDKNVKAVNGLGRAAKTALRLFLYLEENPIIEIPKTSAALGVSFKSASDAAGRLCDIGILSRSTENRRNRTFAYTAYLDLLREGT